MPAAPQRLEDLPAVARALLQRGHADGIARYGELGLALDDYAADVVALVKSARAALGHETPPDVLVAALHKRALADLYLTRSCEAGHERAWEALVREYESRLAGLARKEGGLRATPEASASELMAELALPPPKARARTHIGTFAGMGALWPWLATNLVRRLWKHERKRAREGGELPEAVPESQDVAPVWAGAVAQETATSLETTLDGVWQDLTREERLALLLKHRHQMRQRAIAKVFGVPEYQVSRFVKRAMGKLREAVEARVRCPDGAEHSTWEHLRAALSAKLASFEALEAPPLGGGPVP